MNRIFNLPLNVFDPIKKFLFLNKDMFAYCSFFLLFLNKRDLFEKKIMEKDLKDHFPNYQGKLSQSNIKH